MAEKTKWAQDEPALVRVIRSTWLVRAESVLAAGSRVARGPVEPHGGARAPVGCPATGPACVPLLMAIQRSEATTTAPR
jgi:hypothetical protein